MNLRRLPGHRLLGVDHRRQHLVIDDDGVGRVARGVAIAGDDHRHRLADVAHGIDRDRAMVGRWKRRADRHRTDELGNLRAGEHRLDTRHALGGADVDRANPAVGDVAPREGRMQHADDLQVVDIGAQTLNQTRILAPLDALPDQLWKYRSCGHDPTPCWRRAAPR